MHSIVDELCGVMAERRKGNQLTGTQVYKYQLCNSVENRHFWNCLYRGSRNDI